MSLAARDVAYEYGAGTAYGQPALDGVTLEVERGQLAVVLGGTGSGKSTLLRLCAGLMPPSYGEVRVDDDGGPLAGVGRTGTRGLVGIVFQDPETQFFAETVVADVAFGPRNLGADDEQAREAAERSLADVGLDPAVFGQRSPFTLSGGEARRAAIAGVLAMEPGYLLLDEPTAGLDAAGRAAVAGAIERARERAGVVVVSHDVAEFLPVADTVLVLDGGREAFAGTPAELLSHSFLLEEAGLAVPDVLAVLLMARERGFDIPALTLDPEAAAAALASAVGSSR